MSETYQKVVFTGARTGNKLVQVADVGVVGRGDVIVMPVEQAELNAELLPTADGGAESDFALVGEPYDLSAEDWRVVNGEQQAEYIAAHQKAIDKAARRAATGRDPDDEPEFAVADEKTTAKIEAAEAERLAAEERAAAEAEAAAQAVADAAGGND